VSIADKREMTTRIRTASGEPPPPCVQPLLRRSTRRGETLSPLQFSDHVDCDGAAFFKAAAELGLEGIVSKRAASRYCSGRSRSWLKTKDMVESEFVLLGTDGDANGIPWALLASDGDGELKAG
jgi:bifunctional non-homologous end joining protein LigD